MAMSTHCTTSLTTDTLHFVCIGQYSDVQALQQEAVCLGLGLGLGLPRPHTLHYPQPHRHHVAVAILIPSHLSHLHTRSHSLVAPRQD